MDVGAWLKGLGLGQYYEIFLANDIDGELLRGLTADDLKELGVASFGHRKRLLGAIADLGPDGGPRPSPAPAPLAAQTPRHLAERILDARAALEGERKQVTVLFADIEGSLDADRDLDPEDARPILDAAIERHDDGGAPLRGHRQQGAGRRHHGPVRRADRARGSRGARLLRRARHAEGDGAIGTSACAATASRSARGSVCIGRGGGAHDRQRSRMDYDAMGPTVHLAAAWSSWRAPAPSG